jgi:hypothetical protein
VYSSTLDQIRVQNNFKLTSGILGLGPSANRYSVLVDLSIELLDFEDRAEKSTEALPLLSAQSASYLAKDSLGFRLKQIRRADGHDGSEDSI